MNAVVRVLAVMDTAVTLLATAHGLSAADTDPLAGKTYKDASALVAEGGNKSVIATVVGSRLAIDDCIVTTWRKSNFRDIGGKERAGAVLLNLNCNGLVASAGSPGNSVTSAEGKLAKADIETGEWCS